ncbi:MAG: hypothetical protein IJJ44_12580 [Solobacterium sp.]|nr:hypothetical protein [Solobacterium sp.]
MMTIKDMMSAVSNCEKVIVVKEYEARTGKVVVEVYTGTGEFRVSHSNKNLHITPTWCKYRTDAILHAQFLSRY